MYNLSMDVYRPQFSTGSSKTSLSFPNSIWTSLYSKIVAPEVNDSQKCPSKDEDLDVNGVLLERKEQSKLKKPQVPN